MPYTPHDIIESRITGGKPNARGKDTRKYPVIDKNGKVSRVPVWLAREFFKMSADVERYGISGDKFYKEFANPRFAMMAYRNLTDFQYEEWKEANGEIWKFDPTHTSEVQSLREADAEKSAEIAKLKAQLEAMQSKSEKGVKPTAHELPLDKKPNTEPGLEKKQEAIPQAEGGQK